MMTISWVSHGENELTIWKEVDKWVLWADDEIDELLMASRGQSFLGGNCWPVTRGQAGPQSSPTSWTTFTCSLCGSASSCSLCDVTGALALWLGFLPWMFLQLSFLPWMFLQLSFLQTSQPLRELEQFLASRNVLQENTSERKLGCRYLELYNHFHSLIPQLLSGTAI